MTLNLRVEILKVFSLELNFSSGKKIREKEEKVEEISNDTGTAK